MYVRYEDSYSRQWKTNVEFIYQAPDRPAFAARVFGAVFDEIVPILGCQNHPFLAREWAQIMNMCAERMHKYANLPNWNEVVEVELAATKG